MRPRRWVLVTGVPRSGTTFVGRVLATSVRCDYVHEPFNPQVGLPWVSRLFTYAPPDSPELDDELSRLMRYDVRLRTAFFPQDSVARRAAKRVIGSRGPVYLRLAKLNPFTETAVMKDPHAALLAPVLARRHGFRVVVVVRHPVAVVASFRARGWPPGRALEELLGDPCAASEVLGSDRGRVERVLESPRVDVEGPAVLWRVLTRFLVDAADADPSRVSLVRHEDLGTRTHETFSTVFSHCGLPYGRRVRSRVERWTREGLSASGRGLRRDAASLAREAPAALPEEGRELVLEHTRALTERLYGSGRSVGTDGA